MADPLQLDDADRNASLLDLWSLTHLVWGALLAVVFVPFWALVIMVLWEPFEILVLSPLMARKWGVRFGHESLRNSLLDLVVDVLGVLLGAYVLQPLWNPFPPIGG